MASYEAIQQRIHDGLSGPFSIDVVDRGQFSLGYGSFLKGNIRFGRDLRIGNGTYIVSENSQVFLGDEVDIGDLNVIKVNDHDPANKGKGVTLLHGTMTKSHVTLENAVTVGSNVYLGTGTILGRNISIGDGCRLNQGSNIAKNVVIGARNVFYNCTIGSAPEGCERTPKEIQDTSVLIGDDNIFREYVTINRGSHKHDADGKTRIGNGNLVLSKVQIGHDCQIGDFNEIISESGLAGHVWVGNNVRVSGQAGIAPFVHLGDYSFIGGRSAVTGDVLPYARVDGTPATFRGVNEGRLERLYKRDKAKIKKAYSQIKEAYRIVRDMTVPNEQLIARLRELKTQQANEIADFIERFGFEKLLRKRH